MKNVILSAAAVALVAAAANAQVTNGGFETGDFTGWTLGAGINYTTVQTFAAHSGSWGCYTGPIPANSISQNLTGVNAGDTVEVHFWLALSGSPNSFSATLDGLNLVAPMVDSGDFGYTEFVGTVNVTNANPALVFTFYNSPSYWSMDDVSAIVTPTPGAAAVLGLGGLAMGRRRRA